MKKNKNKLFMENKKLIDLGIIKIPVKRKEAVEIDEENLAMLKKLREQVEQIDSVEALEALESELEEIGVLDTDKMRKLKRKRDRKLSQRELFERSIRCDAETIARTIKVAKEFVAKQKQLEQEKELILEKGERTKEGGQKSKDEKTRGSNGTRTMIRSRERGGRTHDR